MANFKCTFFVNAGQRGTSHTFFRTGTVHEECVEPCNRLVAILQRFCALGAGYKAFRISDDAIPGDAYLRVAFQGKPAVGGQALNPDVPPACLYLRVGAGGNYQRQLALTLVPDDWIKYVGSAAVEPPGDVNDLVTLLQLELRAGWQIKAISKEIANAPKAITAIDPAAPADLASYNCTVPAHGITKATEITVAGAPEIYSLNGQRVCRPAVIGGAPSPDVLNISVPVFQVPVPYFRKGTIKLHNYNYFAITYTEFVRFSTRRVGRPFGVRRGRRRRRKTSGFTPAGK